MATDVERQNSGTNEIESEPTEEMVADELVERFDRTTMAAITGGIGAGIAMGLLLNDTMPTIGGLVGVETTLGGWSLHMIIAVVLAIVFAAAVQSRWLAPYADSVLRTTLLGAVYGGVVLTVLAGGVALPIWANAALDAGMAVPTITTQSFLNHLVYGVVLGGVYGLVRSRSRVEATSERSVAQ